MKFPSARRVLFQVHMWVGLILGLFFVAISLSGSILVYDDKLAELFAPVPKARVAGQRLPLATLISAATAAVEPDEGGQIKVVLPVELGDAAVVGLMGKGHEGATPQQPGVSLQVYVDPSSGQVLGIRRAGLLPVFSWLHQFHGSLKLGREFGRPLVGWLGVGMVLLGMTGLILWWPKRGQWKYAFLVRRTATGLRFHRELHGAAGIWIFAAFMAVSFSGVAITFPQTIRSMLALVVEGPAPAFNLREGPKVEPVENAKRLGPDHVALIAQKAHPDMTLLSVTVPSHYTQALSAAMASRFGTTATLYINPYTGAMMAVRDPANYGGVESFMALQRPMHDGQGSLGPMWEFLVFLSGLAPLLFVITGTTMWLKKRKLRIQ